MFFLCITRTIVNVVDIVDQDTIGIPDVYLFSRIKSLIKKLLKLYVLHGEHAHT